MVASIIAALVSAYMCVTCRSDISCCATQPESVGTLSQNPAAVGVPGFSAQNAAICVCSAVRVSEICRISASAVLKAGEPNAGGAPGRNWLPDVRNQGVIPGNCPPATGKPTALVVQNPGPTGGAGLRKMLNPSPIARATIVAPTARPIASAAAKAGCGCPGPALACAVTRSSSICTLVGNR